MDPGNYRFMVIGEDIALMDATVAAGETYHVLVRAWLVFATGVTYWRYFELQPLNEQIPEIREWYARSQQVTPDAAGAESGANALERQRENIREFTERWEAQGERPHLHTPTLH
jgi:hypothetical protein